DGRLGVRPELHYATNFLPTVGLQLFDRRLRPEGSRLLLRALTGGPGALHTSMYLEGPPWLGLSLHGGGWRRRDRLFAGIGPQSRAQLEANGQGQTRYGSDGAFADLRWTRRLPWRLTFATHADIQRRTYQDDLVVGGPPVSQFYGLPPA